jgi:preprotein translocase subunit SecF
MQDFYKQGYKRFMLIPIILAIPMLFLVFIFPGIQPGVDLTGGNVLIIRSSQPIVESKLTEVLRANFGLQELKVSTISSPTGYGAWIQYNKDPFVVSIESLINRAEDSLNDQNASIAFSVTALRDMNLPSTGFSSSKVALLSAQQGLANYKEGFEKKLESTLKTELALGDSVEFQKREISATLGSATFSSSLFIALLGFVFISIVIFISFRQFIPSAAIIECMCFDALAGLTGMALLHIPLSLTTLPAILMLIGYSVDTDILLTSRMLKGKEGTPGQRATESLKTGITMTATIIVALTSMLIVSYYYQIDVIYQISAILLFGLVGDLIATWFMNAPILLWWLERKEKRKAHGN